MYYNEYTLIDETKDCTEDNHLFRYYDYGDDFFLTAYEIQEITPCGFWIKRDRHSPFNKKENSRWVSKEGRKRFAYPTKKKALTSFYYRKNRQVEYLKFKLANAIELRNMAETMLNDLKKQDD